MEFSDSRKNLEGGPINVCHITSNVDVCGQRLDRLCPLKRQIWATEQSHLRQMVEAFNHSEEFMSEIH